MATNTGKKREFDVEDLVPAQIAGLMFLIQFRIVELTAYGGAVNLEQTFAVGPIEFSLTFVISLVALVVIVVTNELQAEDVMFWNEDEGLDQAYGVAIACMVALLFLIEFSTWANDLITGSDVLATVAFGVSAAAVWAIVWVR